MNKQFQEDAAAGVAISLMFIGPLVLTISWVGAVLIGIGFAGMVALFFRILLRAHL